MGRDPYTSGEFLELVTLCSGIVLLSPMSLFLLFKGSSYSQKSGARFQTPALEDIPVKNVLPESYVAFILQDYPEHLLQRKQNGLLRHIMSSMDASQPWTVTSVEINNEVVHTIAAGNSLGDRVQIYAWPAICPTAAAGGPTGIIDVLSTRK